MVPDSVARRPLALPPRDGDVERQQDDGRGVDRHGRGDAAERNPGEELLHVVERIDGDPDPPDLALASGWSES